MDPLSLIIGFIGGCVLGGTVAVKLYKAGRLIKELEDLELL